MGPRGLTLSAEAPTSICPYLASRQPRSCRLPNQVGLVLLNGAEASRGQFGIIGASPVRKTMGDKKQHLQTREIRVLLACRVSFKTSHLGSVELRKNQHTPPVAQDVPNANAACTHVAGGSFLHFFVLFVPQLGSKNVTIHMFDTTYNGTVE